MSTTYPTRKAASFKGGDYIVIGCVAYEVVDTFSNSYDSTTIRYLRANGAVSSITVRDNTNIAFA